MPRITPKNKNLDFDHLYEAALTLPEGEERARLFQKANQMLVDDCVAISGYSRVRIHIWRRDLLIFPERELTGSFLSLLI